jgi:Na+/phosphate symporter
MQAALTSRPREIAAFFMMLLVAWNTAEFALQPVRRSPTDELLILIFTVAVVVFLPYVRAPMRWSAIGAFVAVLAHWLFAIAGIYLASASEGFGKAGPIVAALLLTVALYGTSKAMRETSAAAGGG